MSNTEKINYWLIPMNYFLCDFKNLKKEVRTKGEIWWQVPGKPQLYKKAGWKIKTELALSIHKDDVVYFYITNLPSNDNRGLSRILLRGVVQNDPTPVDYNEVYSEPKKNEKIIGFTIGSFTTLKKELLDNNEFLSLSNIKANYADFIHPQGKNWPNTEKQNFNEDLIIDLEKLFTQKQRQNNFEALINNFDRTCYFCGKLGKKSDHKTFKGRNGINYYEYHHFIQQSQAEDYPELKDAVYSPANGLFLCSNCHNKFHYGTVEDILIMIKKVLEDSNTQKMLDDNFRKTIGRIIKKTDDVISNDDIANWLLTEYTTNK